jgi:hypothetical protein
MTQTQHILVDQAAQKKVTPVALFFGSRGEFRQHSLRVPIDHERGAQGNLTPAWVGRTEVIRFLMIPRNFEQTLGARLPLVTDVSGLGYL